MVHRSPKAVKKQIDIRAKEAQFWHEMKRELLQMLDNKKGKLGRDLLARKVSPGIIKKLYMNCVKICIAAPVHASTCMTALVSQKMGSGFALCVSHVNPFLTETEFLAYNQACPV